MQYTMSVDDQELVEAIEGPVSFFLQALENSKKFQVGDYVIAKKISKIERHRKDTPEYICDSCGSPKKFQVVHVDNSGVRYIKRLSSKNRHVGEMMPMLDMSLLHMLDRIDVVNHDAIYIVYEIDPDYADALVLGEGASYDPNQEARSKSLLRKQIVDYNKSICIRTHSTDKARRFLSQHVKVGNTIWRSNTTSWTIVSTGPNLGYKDGSKCVAEIVLTNGAKKRLTLTDFLSKTFYTQRPRSYNELRNLNI